MSITRNGFQSIVEAQPAPAEAGDFAGTNPRASVNCGPGGAVADSDGVYVGRFAWFDPATGLASNTEASNNIIGFVHRENQALITEFLGSASLIVPEGYPVTLMNQGDYWATFTAGAAIGDRVYADPATGLATTTSGGNIATNFYVASPVLVDAVTTAALTNDGTYGKGTYDVSAVASGVIAVGQVLTGTGVPANVFVTAQLTGTPGGIGKYSTNSLAVVGSTTITASAGKVGKITTWNN